jgi:hypothetical protein
MPFFHCTSDPRFFLIDFINQGPMSQGLALLPDRMDSINARAQMLKTGLQESRLEERRQLINTKNGIKPLGPAAGLWQFERGGIQGVLTHVATRDHIRVVCHARDVPANVEAIWEAIQSDDVLAAALARLNYWWSHKPMPDLHDLEGSWNEYLWCWRPGAYSNGSEAQKTELFKKWSQHHNRIRDYFSLMLK